MATFLMSSPTGSTSQWRHFSWLKQPTLSQAPRTSQRRHFSWLKQPTLSRAPGPANGDISHGLKQPDLSGAPGPANGDIFHGLSNQLSHGLQDQPMATFLMAKATSPLTGSRTSDGDVSHGSTRGNLSWVSRGPANGDISHGSTARYLPWFPTSSRGDVSHGPKGVPTFKNGLFSWFNGATLMGAKATLC